MCGWLVPQEGRASKLVCQLLHIHIRTSRLPSTPYDSQLLIHSRFYLVNTYYLTRMYRTPRQIGHASNSSSERPAVDTRACAGADVPEDPLRDVLRQTSYVWYHPTCFLDSRYSSRLKYSSTSSLAPSLSPLPGVKKLWRDRPQ